jgi:hypothetical protein
MSMTLSEAQAYFTRLADQQDPAQQEMLSDALAALLRDATKAVKPDEPAAPAGDSPAGMSLEEAMETMSDVRTICDDEGLESGKVIEAVNVLIRDAVEQQRKKAQRVVDEANKILEQHREKGEGPVGVLPIGVLPGKSPEEEGGGFLAELQMVVEILGPLLPKVTELYERKMTTEAEIYRMKMGAKSWRQTRERLEAAHTQRLGGLVEMATMLLRTGAKLPAEALDELDRAAKILTVGGAPPMGSPLRYPPGSPGHDPNCPLCAPMRAPSHRPGSPSPQPAPARGPFARPSAPGDVVPLRPSVTTPESGAPEQPSSGDAKDPPDGPPSP